MIYTHAAVAIVAASVAFATAWRVQSWRFDSERLAAAEQVREVERFRRQAANSSAAKHEADRVSIRRQFAKVNEDLQHAAKSMGDRSCLADDGLRAAQAAIARANGDPGESSGSVPAPAKP